MFPNLRFHDEPSPYRDFCRDAWWSICPATVVTAADTYSHVPPYAVHVLWLVACVLVGRVLARTFRT